MVHDLLTKKLKFPEIIIWIIYILWPMWAFTFVSLSDFRIIHYERQGFFIHRTIAYVGIGLQAAGPLFGTMMSHFLQKKVSWWLSILLGMLLCVVLIMVGSMVWAASVIK